VEVVGDTPPPRPAAVTAGLTVEITCSGGVVVRLREEVSPEVLQRVIAACGQCHRVAAESVVELREVRSC
jgi:hypothetical protein